MHKIQQSELYSLFPHYDVIVDDAKCIITKYIQCRFPKSKNRRIMRKWAKVGNYRDNFHIEETFVSYIDIQHNIIITNSLDYVRCHRVVGKDLT